MRQSKQAKTNAGGRPLSYDPALVREIIEASLAAGIPAADLDAPYVKEKLCNDHGVKGSIRIEALESLVSANLVEIVDARNRTLLKALPDGIALAVDEAVAATGRQLLLILARQHAVSQAAADQTCEELRSDKRNAQHRIADLEGALAEAEEAYHALARERDEMADQLAKLEETLRVTQTQVERLGSEPSGVDRLLAELRNPAIRNDIKSILSDIVTYPSPPA